jgi:hypothetical protein
VLFKRGTTILCSLKESLPETGAIIEFNGLLTTEDGGYPFKGQKDLSPAFETTFNSYILSLSFPSMIAESAARCGLGPNQAGISENVLPFLTCETLSGDADLEFRMWVC